MAAKHALLSVGVMRHVLGEAVFKDLQREVSKTVQRTVGNYDMFVYRHIQSYRTMQYNAVNMNI